MADADTGRDVIQYYQLEWDNGDSTKLESDSWTELTSSSSNPTDLTFTQSSGITPFTNSTNFRYRLRAMNGVGFGPYSTVITVRTDRTPLAMDPPTNGTVAPKSIDVSWPALTGYENTGRDPLDGYKLEYDGGSGWEIITITDPSTLTFTHTKASSFPFNADRTAYTVKYRMIARNGVGFGLPSTELTVETLKIPKKVSSVTQVGDVNPSQFVIQWTRLDNSVIDDNGGDPIINYLIEWNEVTTPANSIWIEIGLVAETIDTLTVPQSTPGYKIGTQYNIRVAAVNNVDVGVYSDSLIVETDNAPVSMYTPYDDPSSTATSLLVAWLPITDPEDTGGDPIIYYQLEWDQGTGSWVVLNPDTNTLITQYLLTQSTDGIVAGTTYYFRVTPKNGVGFGQVSSTVGLIPASPPDQMATVTASVVGTDVVISWTEPANNGRPITNYDIQVQTKTSGTWYSYTTTCDGSLASVVTARTCSIPMTILGDNPFNLLKGDLIAVQARAANLKGFQSLYSTANTVSPTMETIPSAPGTVTRQGSTTDTFLSVQWSAISANSAASGGSTCSIISYHLQMNQGNNTDTNLDVWTDLVGLSPATNTLTTFSTTAVIGGTKYSMRLRTLNKYGWSDWSTIASIRAARKPGNSMTITTTNSTTYMQISWTEPTKYGLDITEYFIAIQKKTGSQWVYNSQCNGADPSTVASRSCLIQFSTLRTTYSYAYPDTITVRISAKNDEGWGNNQTTTGAGTIQTEPPSPSSTVSGVLATTDDTKITITWVQMLTLASWGGYEISSYEVWWTDKDGTFPYELLYTDSKPFQLTYTHKNKGTTPDAGDTPHATQAIVGGTQYKFKYRGVNIHGSGAFSTETLVYASTVPDQLDPIVTSLYNKTVTIQWSATPNDHMQQVKSYRVRFRAKNNSFVDETNICNGANSIIVSNMRCTAQMALFVSNLGLAIDDLIVAQIEAWNIMGYSTPSIANSLGVTVKKLPQTAPSNLQRGSSTGKTQMHLTWTGLSSSSDTGGQDVDYIVQYDKATNGVSWTTIATSTSNLTNFLNGDPGTFTTGKAYQFRVAGWNDFGTGPYSSGFTIWSAITPSGLADPTTTLNENTYVGEDDLIVIKWTPPTDDGGLTVSYRIEVLMKSGVWTEIDYPNECTEKGTITNYQVPVVSAALSNLQCTMLVSKLKSKYGLLEGDTVLSRVTAYHVVGSVTSTLTGAGTAVIPTVPCFRTTFPRVFGGTNDDTMITSMDVDPLGNVVVAGSTQDSGLLGRTYGQTLPIVMYIAKGNFFAWGRQIETNDGVTSNIFSSILDITFRVDGDKIALALDRTGSYANALTIVVLNKDGSLYGSFKESTNIRAKVNITGLIFDSSNFITMALDVSQDAVVDTKRTAAIIRFSVANPTSTSITPTYYIVGGATTKLSQAFCLERVKNDSSLVYASAMLQDASSNRKSILARISTTTPQTPSRYVQYSTTTASADYNTDQSISVIKRMNLYEDEVNNIHYISACIHSQDGYKLHFGQFILTGTTSMTVLIPQAVNRWFCLGIFQKVQNMAYVVYNDRSANSPSGYSLFYGRIDYANKKIDSIPIINHDGSNNYGGVNFIHQARFYYFGQTQKLITSSTYNYSKKVGFIDLFDQTESTFCQSSSQNYNFASGVTTTTLDPIVTANMNWVTTGYSSGPVFTVQTGRTFRAFTLSAGMTSLNLNAPLINNTWCPIVTSPAPVTLSAPTMNSVLLFYDPDASSYPVQEVPFSAFTPSRSCPDTVFYYNTFLADTSQSLPSFVTFDQANSKYSFAISSTLHVGTYKIMLQSTLGNNMTSSVQFTVQVASPCLNLQINMPTLASTPTYDISDLVPLYVNLDWEVVAPPTASCSAQYFLFTLVNATSGVSVDTSVFTIVTTGPGQQQIKVQTSAIPAAKLWSDLKIEARLQGDLVKSHTYSIMITNKCAVTQITPVSIPEQVYYHGRDAYELKFAWSESVGTCGPIVYAAKAYDSLSPSSNATLDSGVFTYPLVVNAINDTFKIYTNDVTKVGTYQVRVYASLGVGGFQQANTIFTVQVIKDPCSYYVYNPSFVEDLTLWVNQSNQIVNIPPFTMSDPSWICNFTYELRTGTGTTLDSVFVTKEIALQGDGTNITLVTADKTKIELSPQTVRVRGWPARQPGTSVQLTFRIFVAYLEKTDCSSGKYYDPVSDQCVACTSPCSSCYDATRCKWCVANHIYVASTESCLYQDPNTPAVSCPLGTFRDAEMNYCRTCPTFCKTCSSQTVCTQCVPNYSLVDGKCYASRVCPPNYRYDDVSQGCVACPANCEACSSTQCSFCQSGWYLDTVNKVCTQNCPVGTYGDDPSRVCMVCQPECAACHTNNYTCTACNDYGGVQHYLFKTTCVSRCPYLNYYQNEPARKCDPCKAECKICVNAIDDCIVCNEGSVISGRECLNSCPPSYYITVIGTCFQCDPACEACYGSQNSMCTKCVSGQYLTGNTCEAKCQDPLFPDPSTRSCKSCPYYCNQCTQADNCMKCKTGYLQVPLNCQGEYFLKTSSTFSMSVPLNTALVPESYDPTETAFEVWFKSNNAQSMQIEIILGLSPYKLRKKSGTGQIQFNWGDFNFCDTSAIRSDQWYHYAVSMSEDGAKLSCYLDGQVVQNGLQSVIGLTNNIQKFKEITFGSSIIDKKPSESNFNGYIKEFRWWKNVRSQFHFNNFKNIGLTSINSFSPPNQLLAYWKLDERTSMTLFTDYASLGSVTYTPPVVALADIIEMREIYLKFCPEGNYNYFNETLNMQTCLPCSESCQNCNGPTDQNCTSCVNPYKLLETEQKCIITASCPAGYWQDKNQDCWPCHPYCTNCYGGDQFQCTACKSGFFKAYKRTGCVDSCPRGLYGNYLTQSCSANPIVKSVYPEDGEVISYGTYIDLFADYEILNNEPRNTYTYGWIIKKLNSDLDIAKDAAKPYANTDILRVHIDNNIIEPNNYYNITFYVKGDDTVYNGMLGSIFNVIYIGIPPKSGKCIILPPQGISGVTEFKLQTTGWTDPDGFSEFRFFYSFDDGTTFLPVKQSNKLQNDLKYVFEPTYKTSNGKLRCQVKSIKGFISYVDTPFLLSRRSSANSRVDLLKYDLSSVTSIGDSMRKAFQLLMIAQDQGSLVSTKSPVFDKKIEPEMCNEQLCNFNGQCLYNYFSRRYYCLCANQKAGVNCTFRNATELQMIRDFAFQNALLFQQYQITSPERLLLPPQNNFNLRNLQSSAVGNTYDYEFLKIVTTYFDLMSSDLFDKVHNIIISRVLKLSQSLEETDYSEAQQCLQIVSNMLEYIDFELLQSNFTNSFAGNQQLQDRLTENLKKTMNLFDKIKNVTLYKLSFLQTQIQMTSKMISYRQVLTTKDTILTMPATEGVKKQYQTFVKLSSANLKDNRLSKNFIVEAVSYAINPHQLTNVDRIASNIYDINIYNTQRTVTQNVVTKVNFDGLTVPVDIFFTSYDCQNVTDFFKDYNALSQFKNIDRLKKEEMIKKSNLSCVYWREDSYWSQSGCTLVGIDATHIQCACDHLGSSFGVQFQTPKLSFSAPLLENTTVKAESTNNKVLGLSDIIRWPLSEYFRNLGELWQHNRPSFISFIVKPGAIVLLLFWSMFLSSLIYYSGRDELRRHNMTKMQNRDDLAEIKDDHAQNLSQVIRDLIVRDFLTENGKFIQKQMKKTAPKLSKKQAQPPTIKIYEEMSKEDQKKYKKRARRKVFGMPGTLCQRVDRVYQKTMKHNAVNPNAKMSFFTEELKNNLWIGLIAKTSKIAPRHVRLALMYFYASLYIQILTIVFAFELQEYITDVALFQVVLLAFICQVSVWCITIPVALLFRMPLHLRRMIAGVRTKKVNKAFKEIDKHMGWRYSVGYLICLTSYVSMTAMVLVFTLFYPQNYIMGWVFNIILLYLFDLVVFTFMLAAVQLANIMISAKIKCWFKVWAAIEIFRYVKNLRG